MLKIRLSRHGRKNAPYYRVVLTEHTKAVKSGYKKILGGYDPLKHEFTADVDAIKGRIGKGAQPSERVAKLLYKKTEDKFFAKFFVERERIRAIKTPSEEEKEIFSEVEEKTKDKKEIENVKEEPREKNKDKELEVEKPEIVENVETKKNAKTEVVVKNPIEDAKEGASSEKDLKTEIEGGGSPKEETSEIKEEKK